MGVASDIVATYRRPGRVMARLMAGGPREDRALALLICACALMFVAQMPKLARQSFQTGEELNMLLGGSLLAVVFIAPLLFYCLAGVSHLIAKLIGGQGGFWQARLVLFWSLLASTPLILLHGLVAGFIGPGPQMTLVGAIWFAVFLWFWVSGLWQAEKRVTA
ncbi:MAG: YIP1 family protein [Aliishimia sp.]